MRYLILCILMASCARPAPVFVVPRELTAQDIEHIKGLLEEKEIFEYIYMRLRQDIYDDIMRQPPICVEDTPGHYDCRGGHEKVQ